MVVIGRQVYDDVIPFIVSVDGVEAEVRVGLIAGCRSAGHLTCRRFDGKRTLNLATIPPAFLSIT